VLDYDREAARYDVTRGGDARADAAAHAIETLLPVAARGVVRIADVGCGTGIVTVRLLRPGRSVIGIDRSAGMAAVAAGRLPGRITLGNVTRLPLASGSVDVVTMVWLLHLLPAAAAATAIAEAGRVLRPGGLLITTVGKNDAAFEAADDDAAAIVAPVRARFGHDQMDRLARVVDIGGQHGLAHAAQTTFVGRGQGISPRRWRKRLAGSAVEWVGAAGRERADALCAELNRLPDQDRDRPDPVYQLAALRRD
jgi:ubiquinone/menaquinone biosynthesis C-methylase UbiE